MVIRSYLRSNSKKENYLDVLVGNAIIEIRDVELGSSFDGGGSASRSCVRRSLIRVHVVLPRGLRRLNRLNS